MFILHVVKDQMKKNRVVVLYRFHCETVGEVKMWKGICTPLLYTDVIIYALIQMPV